MVRSWQNSATPNFISAAAPTNESSISRIRRRSRSKEQSAFSRSNNRNEHKIERFVLVFSVLVCSAHKITFFVRVYATRVLFVYNAVAELCELTAVPTACCTYEVAGDALELVDVLSAAVRTLCKSLVCILEAAVHTTVTVVVH